MGQRLRNKRNANYNAVPTSAITDFGEILINYNRNSPMLFIKKDNNEIAKFVDKDYVDSMSGDFATKSELQDDEKVIAAGFANTIWDIKTTNNASASGKSGNTFTIYIPKSESTDSATTAVSAETSLFALSADTLDGKHASDFQPVGNYLSASTKYALSDSVSGVALSAKTAASADTLDGHDSGDFALLHSANTFTEGQVITRSTSGAILELTSTASSTNFLLTRGSGSQCVLEAGSSVGLFGTKSNHPLQIRTNYTNRMTVGTDGSVTLATDVADSSNNNQVATTKWVNSKLSGYTKGSFLSASTTYALSDTIGGVALSADTLDGKHASDFQPVGNYLSASTQYAPCAHTHSHSDISDWSTEMAKKANTATTLSGYGITDAKISNGTITLGSNTITPITAETSITTASTGDGNVVTAISADKHKITYTLGKTVATSADTVSALSNKVDKVDGKQLSTNDYTTDDKNKLGTIAASAQVNTIETVKVNGTALTITNKAVDITVPSYVLSAVTAESGYSKTYKLFKDGTQVGDSINVPLDMFVTSGGVTTEGGVKVVRLWLANSGNTHIDINVNDLSVAYGADETTITKSEANIFSVKNNVFALSGHNHDDKYQAKGSYLSASTKYALADAVSGVALSAKTSLDSGKLGGIAPSGYSKVLIVNVDHITGSTEETGDKTGTCDKTVAQIKQYIASGYTCYWKVTDLNNMYVLINFSAGLLSGVFYNKESGDNINIWVLSQNGSILTIYPRWISESGHTHSDYLSSATTYALSNTVGGIAYSADTLDGYHASAFSLSSHTHNYLSSATTYALSNTVGGIALSADTLDGHHASDFALAGQYLPLSGGEMTGNILMSNDSGLYFGPESAVTITLDNGEELTLKALTINIDAGSTLRVTNGFTHSSDATSGKCYATDGSLQPIAIAASGIALSADTLDGKHASDFQPVGGYLSASTQYAPCAHTHTQYVNKTGDTMTGDLTMQAQILMESEIDMQGNSIYINNDTGRIIEDDGDGLRIEANDYIWLDGQSGTVVTKGLLAEDEDDRSATKYFATDGTIQTIQTGGGAYLPLSGGTMDGNILMDNNSIKTINELGFENSNGFIAFDGNNYTDPWAGQGEGLRVDGDVIGKSAYFNGSLFVNNSNIFDMYNINARNHELNILAGGDITISGDALTTYSNSDTVINSGNEIILSAASGSFDAYCNDDIDIESVQGTSHFTGYDGVEITSNTGNIALYAGATEYLVTSGSVYPATTNAKDLGLKTNAWRNIYSQYSYSVNGFYQTSDEKLKEFQNDVEVNFDELKTIPKKYFTWKDNDDKIQMGTSAQKLELVYPELVSTSEEGIKSVDYARLSIVALKAVDELNDKIILLTEKLKYANEHIAKLEERLDNLDKE